MSRVRLNRDSPTVQAQEDIRCEKCNALIAVEEGMVDEQGFELCGGHFRDVGIVAGAWPMQRAVEQATIAQAGGTAELIDQPLVNRFRLVDT